jgi:hypothetical protein
MDHICHFLMIENGQPQGRAAIRGQERRATAAFVTGAHQKEPAHDDGAALRKAPHLSARIAEPE